MTFAPQLTMTSQILFDVMDSNEEEFKMFYAQAAQITNEVFGKKRTLFNPIYVSNICLADCSYCGFRVSNKEITRKNLDSKQAIQEGRFLLKRGISNILVVAGDYKHDKYVEMILANIRVIKKDINPVWTGLEVATLEIGEYENFKEAGINSVIVFQETYDRKRYDELHHETEYKNNFDFRYNAQERAIRAGIDEVGFGVLYGIGFWKKDTIAMAQHALSLLKKYPSIKLRFAFPRLRQSVGQSEGCRTETITESQLLRAIVGVRLLFPNASIVLTGRESIAFLTEHADVVNVLGYAGSTLVGGYTIDSEGLEQYELNTDNAFEDFTDKLTKNGFDLTSK